MFAKNIIMFWPDCVVSHPVRLLVFIVYGVINILIIY
jgi:hypothetical protein